MMSRDLLPPNRTPLEAALAEATALDLDPTPLRHLSDATRCPTALLPWLAWAMSVDGWDEAIAEQPRRQLLRRSIEIHKHKGTAGAVRRALGALGVTVEFKEWQDIPGSVPYTFALVAWVNENAAADEDAVLTPQLYRRLQSIVDAAKNERSHYSVKIGARFDHGIRVVNATQTRSLLRGSAETSPVQPRVLTQLLPLVNAANLRAIAHRSAEAQPVAVAAGGTLSCAGAFRARAIIHITMEAR